MGNPDKTFLHAGCGDSAPELLPRYFQNSGWKEVRLDINPNVKLDIVGSITDMSAVARASFDAVYSSHNIEHLYPHEVALAVREFARVLRPDGFLMITCPDLQSVAAKVAEGNLTEAIYNSAVGEISPIDVIYGFRRDLADGNYWMAHKTGFTQRTLSECLIENGFAKVSVVRHIKVFALAGLAYREQNPNVVNIDALGEHATGFPSI